MKLSLCLAALAALSMAPGALSSTAQAQEGYHRTTLQRQDFPGATYQTVTVRTVIDRGAQVPPHTHPGAEMAYVLAGKGALSVKGAPTQRLAAGDSFSIPEGEVHAVRNMGPGPLTLLSTYVVERAKPIASPAGGAGSARLSGPAARP